MADVARDAVKTINSADMEEIRKVIQGLDTPQKRTIQAASYLSVKHALPKTCVGHTIIHENPCQSRLLNMELDRIRYRRKEYTSVYEISRRTFMEKQARKQRKWKQQDDMRVAGMNFPNVRSSGIGGRSSVEVLYKSPRYTDDDDDKTYMGKPLLPYMTLRRERTEFIKRNNKIAVTKLPSVLESDGFKLRRYNSYCGEEFRRMQTKDSQNDGRFMALTDALSPLKSPVDAMLSADQRMVPDTPDDGTKYWFMDDEVSVGSMMPRGVSRDSTRKVTVVFPSVSKETNRRPSVERERTQYDIALKKSSADKARLVAFPAEFQGSKPSSSDTNTSSRSPQGKVVDLNNPIVTELREDKPESPKAPTRKGILKSPKKTSKVITQETVEEKREKIKKDLQTKDLKELKETYGQLKQVDNPDQKDPEDKSDPRQGSAFHSPTMERRFAVKSENRKK